MTNTRKNELIAMIEEAFSDVRLEDGISLSMTEYHDSGGSVSEYAERAKFDERDNWHNISGETLQDFIVTFSFTDLKGFRFYVPAYMIWTIRNHRTSDSIICDFTIYAIDPDHYLFCDVEFTTWFTKKQVYAMIEFLEYCTKNGDTLDSNVAEKNLRKIKSHLKIN